jgi:hypothetical protein
MLISITHLNVYLNVRYFKLKEKVILKFQTALTIHVNYKKERSKYTKIAVIALVTQI